MSKTNITQVAKQVIAEHEQVSTTKVRTIIIKDDHRNLKARIMAIAEEMNRQPRKYRVTQADLWRMGAEAVCRQYEKKDKEQEAQPNA